MKDIIRNIANWFFNRKVSPYWCVLLADCLLVAAATLMSIIIDRGTDFNVFSVARTLIVYLVFYIIGFCVMHTYRGVLRYSSFVDLNRIAIAMFIGSVLILGARVFLRIDDWLAPIRIRELAGTFVFGTSFMLMLRIFVKSMYDRYFSTNQARKAFIYGVRRGGIGLAKNINNEEPKRFALAGFVCDEKDMIGKLLMGVRVYAISDQLPELMKRKDVKALLISPLKQKALVSNKSFVDALLAAGITIYVLDPAVRWDGKSNLSTQMYKEVSIEDLLPRDEIQLDLKAVGEMLSGKKVMITGAAGSIGSEIVRQIAAFSPAHVICIDEAETPMHDLRMEMKRSFPSLPCETIVTSICRADRMEHIFSIARPDYLFHAAAYKHVPMMEDNPVEAVENNIVGTRIIANLAVRYGVKKFVMISTDKAVYPTNVMGCSKRICELYVQSLNNAEKTGEVKGSTQFVTTRFGNVLGSNGSVIPIFRRQIKEGGPVTVTDPRIIRYFMLIPEACKLVLEAGTMGKGGEIFVFDMGQPVRIADLAKRMIRLSGVQNVEIKYTGLRDGEKLYEEVLDDKEKTQPTFNKSIRIARDRYAEYAVVNRDIDELAALCTTFDKMAVVAKMKAIVPEYKSQHSVYEKLDHPASAGDKADDAAPAAEATAENK